jgi:hypothetical protein
MQGKVNPYFGLRVQDGATIHVYLTAMAPAA